jgi:hypothetical protein
MMGGCIGVGYGTSGVGICFRPMPLATNVQAALAGLYGP